MKPVLKFFAFLLILGLVGQFAKYQSANYESSDFAVSDIRTVTEVCNDELVIRLPLDECRLLAYGGLSRIISLKDEIGISFRLLVG